MCSSPLASARSVPGMGARCSAGAVGGRRAARVDDDVPSAGGAALVEVLHRRRHGVRRVGPDEQDGRGVRRCPTAGTAARGRRRTRGFPRWPRTTCRTARCSRSATCAARPGRTCRACRPSRWSGRHRRRPRPRRGPCACWARRIPAATASSASSQPAGRSGLVRSPGTVRSSGVSSRSGWSSSSAAVQPFEHRPPRLVGKSSGCSVAGRSPATMLIPHCSEQYGQWVAVGAAAGGRPDGCGGHAKPVSETMFRSAPRGVTPSIVKTSQPPADGARTTSRDRRVADRCPRDDAARLEAGHGSGQGQGRGRTRRRSQRPSRSTCRASSHRSRWARSAAPRRSSGRSSRRVQVRRRPARVAPALLGAVVAGQGVEAEALVEPVLADRDGAGHPRRAGTAPRPDRGTPRTGTGPGRSR